MLGARVVRGNQVAGLGIDAREVRSLMQAAVIAGEGEVRGVVATAVLPGNDVLDVESDERRGRLRHAAVFASVTGPPTDQSADGRVHYGDGNIASRLRAFAWRMLMTWIAWT